MDVGYELNEKKSMEEGRIFLFSSKKIIILKFNQRIF